MGIYLSFINLHQATNKVVRRYFIYVFLFYAVHLSMSLNMLDWKKAWLLPKNLNDWNTLFSGSLED